MSPLISAGENADADGLSVGTSSLTSITAACDEVEGGRWVSMLYTPDSLAKGTYIDALHGNESGHTYNI